MANEFKVKNGIKFADNTTQTTAGQPVLVSGTNIKTVNGISLLGSGNVSVSAESPLSIGSTPPADPVTKPFWWDNVGGALYISYNDGDSTQWVPATPTPNLTVSIAVVATLPASPDANTIYFVTG